MAAPAHRWNARTACKGVFDPPFSVMRYFCGNVTHVQAFMDKPGVRRSASDLMLSIQTYI